MRKNQNLKSAQGSVSKKTRPWTSPGGVRIRPIQNRSGNCSYRVEVPESIAGRRMLKQFKTPEEAEAYAEVVKVQRMNHGLALFSLTEGQRSIARQAFEKLTAAGLPETALAAATTFYLQHHCPAGGDITVAKLIELYLTQKQVDRLRPRSLADLECRLGIFDRSFGQRLVKTIPAKDLADWLNDPARGEVTRRNYYTVIGGLLNYAVTKKYLAQNFLSEVPKPKPESSTPGILTVAQAKDLLNAALEHPELELGWFVVLGLFLGVRTEELGKLKAADVRIKERFLSISAHIAKKRRIRNVPFCIEVKRGNKVQTMDPVSRWLKRLPAPANGMVAPESALNRFYKKLLPLAGISQWPGNGMRHSFASYHYALTSNAAETCARLGHRRDDVLFDHYRALVSASDAAKFFSLRPPAVVNNIIPIGAGKQTGDSKLSGSAAVLGSASKLTTLNLAFNPVN